ncbi:MAG: PilT/PilU family type 4a pilus ATPase [Candidatus Riflebacteria bacterium]|nr:PilT/PilU family type 4a pilus ATPase [Candidatus Riflebacteria bacterium]
MLETLKTLVAQTQQAGGFDLNIKVGAPPTVRIAGGIRHTVGRAFSLDEMKQFISNLLDKETYYKFQHHGQVDTILSLDDCRLRINTFIQRGSPSLSVRIIPSKIPKLEDCGLPDYLVAQINDARSGLILVTGATNSGKSTTQAAIIDHICRKRSVHVITIEDPIEYKFPEYENSIISQRHVGVHTNDFQTALNSALRQDPDVIVIGELRNPETVTTCLQAAETGHLVMGTLHTMSSAQSISRLVNIFPSDRTDAVRYGIANCLKLVISQVLLRGIDQKSRVLAYELMPTTGAIANLIRTNRVHEINSLLLAGKKFGGCLMQQSIQELLKNKKIRYEDVPSEYNLKVKPTGGLDGNS